MVPTKLSTKLTHKKIQIIASTRNILCSLLVAEEGAMTVLETCGSRSDEWEGVVVVAMVTVAQLILWECGGGRES